MALNEIGSRFSFIFWYLYSYHHQESVSTFYEKALEFRQFSANKEPHTTWAMLKSIPTLQNLGWLISLTYFSKGQLISKGLFGVIVLTKNNNNFFKDFCPSL